MSSVERQPPLSQPRRVRDRVPDITDRVGELPLEPDDPAIGGAFQGAVIAGGGQVAHRCSFDVGEICGVVRWR